MAEEERSQEAEARVVSDEASEDAVGKTSGAEADADDATPELTEEPVLKVNSKVGVSVPDLLDGGMMARNEAIGSVINKALKKVFGDKGKKKEKD